jgi:two-component system phosphate regulon sensor histidine kinase PhoR
MMKEQPDQNKPMILIVDDERIMREGCVRICTTLGCDAKAVGGGEACLSALQEKPADVLLLDLMMPGISGMEVLERVQAQYPDMVVIIITGFATIELAVEAMKKGAYDFISKPFSPDQLRLVVKRALDRRRLQCEAERLRQERETSLRDVAQEQSRLRTIIQAMADGVVVTDKDGLVVLHNPPAERLLDRGDLGLLNCPIEEVVPAEVADMVLNLLHEAPGTTRSVELRLEGIGDLRAHASAIHLSKDEVLGSVTIIQDITPLKDMDRMKSDFVAMVSHELRSPLAAIQQQLELIGRGMEQGVTERERSLLNRAKQRVQGLLNLINDLLDLARVEAGRVVERRELTQLGPLVERTVELYQGLADGKGIGLTLQPFPTLPTVIGDGEALQEVFNNLLSNAISYTPPGGQVWVKGGMRGAYVCVEVVDTGPGIPSPALLKIFDRFYRVKDEHTRNVVGTGLGLPIVKGIVEAHMGSVEVESQPGKGSTFRVLLPEAAMSMEAAGEGQPENQMGDVHGTGHSQCMKKS